MEKRSRNTLIIIISSSASSSNSNSSLGLIFKTHVFYIFALEFVQRYWACVT